MAVRRGIVVAINILVALLCSLVLLPPLLVWRDRRLVPKPEPVAPPPVERSAVLVPGA